MALAFVGTSTAGSATTTTAPAVANGTAGDVIIWFIGWGNSVATSISDRPTISGGVSASATHVGSTFGGGGTYGSGAGPRGISVWTAVSTSATGATDAITFTLPTSGTVGGYAVRVSAAAGFRASVTYTGAIDTTSGDSWAPAGYTNIGATTGDLIVHCTAGAQGTVNPTVALAWTGATVGTQGNLATANQPSGGTIRMNLRQAPITAGTSSAAPTTTSATTGMSGVHGLVRLRETATNVAPTAGAGSDLTNQEPYKPIVITGTDSDSDGTIASRLWSVSPTTGVTLSGQTTATVTATYPGKLTDQTYTMTYTVTDNLGATGNDTMTVLVLAVTTRAVVGGVEVPVNWIQA